MDRFNQARQLLKNRRFFKIVCGAGNEDPVEVKRLTTIYTLAGTSAIDISANETIVMSAQEGIKIAQSLAPKLNKKVGLTPFINVSVGIQGDPHIRKAKIIKANCSSCGVCLEHCDQNAITNEFVIIETRCIGCSKCFDCCSFDAVSFYEKRIDFNYIVPRCIKAGAEMLELHAVTGDDAGVIADWKNIDCLIPNNYVSMCLDRSHLSDRHLLQRIKDVYDITGDRLIIQADGAPMSGGSDDFNTTLQAVSTADIIQKSAIPVKILASGGTNSRTRKLAELCGVTIHGVSVGTFARKLVKPYLLKEDFDSNLGLVADAVSIAEKLVQDNIKIDG